MFSITWALLYCLIFPISISVLVDNEKVSVNKLIKLPGLTILKDVQILKNNQIISLSKMFGSNIKKWSVRRSDLKIIINMSSTALCCLYTKKLIDTIQVVEKHVRQCEKKRNLTQVHFKFSPKETIFFQCISKFKLKSLQTKILHILLTVLNYTKNVYVNVDKNFLIAVMSFYLYINQSTLNTSYINMLVEQESFRNNLINELSRMKLYVQKSIEAFTIRNCSSTTFKTFQTKNKFDKISDLKLRKRHFKRKNFNLKNLRLTKVLEIELIPGKEKTRLKYLTTSYNSQDSALQNIYKDLLTDNIPENLTKYQTLIFECISSVVFCLIDLISKRQHQLVDKVEIFEQTTLPCVTKAIKTLESFNFPGLSQITLKKFKYETMFRRKISQPLESILTHFNYSKFSYKIIEEIINDGLKKIKCNDYIEILENFTANLKNIKSYIKTVVKTNEILCDYEYEEVGFLQHVSKDTSENLSANIKDNCQFSYSAIRHLILSDFILNQCESIAVKVITGHVSLAVLHQCLNILKSVTSTANHLFQRFFVFIIDAIITTLRNDKTTNRRVVDAIVATALYRSNEIFKETFESIIPKTGTEDIRMNLVFSKLEMIKRYHYSIINIFEHYTIHNCSPPSPLVEFVLSYINTLHDKVKDESLNELFLAKTIKSSVTRNSKSIYIPPSYNRSDFCIANLLFDDAFNPNHYEINHFTSILKNINVLWEGEWKSLTEIRDFVKNDINPKYLCKFILTMIKVLFFSVYEKMKAIILPNTTNYNVLIYEEVIRELEFELNYAPYKYYPFKIITMYLMIVRYFVEYLNNMQTIEKNSVIRIIQSEQSSLGLVIKLSDEEIESLVLDVITLNKAHHKNITDLLENLKSFKILWVHLKSIPFVLYARSSSDIVI